MKYIFCAGAPGSKWSSLIKNIYYSPSIDRTDYTDERTYYHDASGKMDLMHLGAYFDPGMEFGSWFDRLSEHSREECEAEFDRPFSGTGVRIIKSHVFANHIDFIKQTWPECPIILALRDNDACLGWWVRCGEFGITYPDYSGYYKNLREMSKHINSQNADLRRFVGDNNLQSVSTNHQLCDVLGIKYPPSEYAQTYKSNDIKLYNIASKGEKK